MLGADVATSARSRIAPAVTAVIGLAAMVESVRLSLGTPGHPGPGLWPFAASCLVLGASAWLFVAGGTHVEAADRGGMVRVLAAVGALGLFVPLFTAIGFPVPGFLLLLVWLRLFGESWRTSVITAALGTIALHVLFVIVLAVPLPVGPLAPGR